jgi:hypothetical protein
MKAQQGRELLVVVMKPRQPRGVTITIESENLADLLLGTIHAIAALRGADDDLVPPRAKAAIAQFLEAMDVGTPEDATWRGLR